MENKTEEQVDEKTEEKYSLEEAEKTESVLDKEIEVVKKKYPGVKLFKLEIPYSDGYILRKQSLKDVKEIYNITVVEETKRKDAFEAKWKDTIEKQQALHAKAKAEGVEVDYTLAENQIPPEYVSDSIELEDAIDDLKNYESFKRCILYPYNINEIIDNEELPSGDSIILVDAIMNISGMMQDNRIVLKEV